MALDTQVVELLGRHALMAELLRDGLEVAVPARDRGVDLIVYADLSRQVASFAARPVQMKAFTARGFGIDREYERFADLILAYVWNLGEPTAAATFAMSYPESVAVADAMGWTETASWREGGVYSTTSLSKRLSALLESYRIQPGRWWALVAGTPSPAAHQPPTTGLS